MIQSLTHFLSHICQSISVKNLKQLFLGFAIAPKHSDALNQITLMQFVRKRKELFVLSAIFCMNLIEVL